MRLISLALVNFRQHLATSIDFRKGMTCVIGANGTGKSTLLEAITFALFGEQRQTKDSIRFHWATSKKFSVTLRFECDGSTLEAMRSNDTASFTDLTSGSPKLLATSLSAVTTAVETRLGITHDQFINSFVAEQKGLAFLNFKNNVDRQKEVAKMLGFDRLQKAEDLSRDKRKSAHAKVEALALVVGDESELRESLRSSKAALEVFRDAIKVASLEKETLESTKEALSSKAELARAYQDINSQMLQIAGTADALKTADVAAKAELESAMKAVERFTEIEPLASKFPGLELRCKGIEASKRSVEQRRAIESEIASKRESIIGANDFIGTRTLPDFDTLESDNREAEKIVNEAASEQLEIRSAWSNANHAASTRLAIASTELKNAERAKAEAEQKIALGVCPECGQPIAESVKTSIDNLVEAVNVATAVVDRCRLELAQPEPSEISTFGSKIKDAQGIIARNVEAIAAGRQTERKIAETKSQIAQWESRIETLDAQLAGLPAAYDEALSARLERELAESRPAYLELKSLLGCESRLERAKESATKAADALTVAMTNHRSLKSQRDALGFETRELVQSALDAEANYGVELKSIISRIAGLNAQEEQAEKSVATAEARIDEHKKRSAELEAAKKDRTLYELLAAEMKALRVTLNASIGPDLSARASENLSLLTNGRYPLLQLDVNFTPSIIEEGVTKSVISGGEEDVVALALRLALSELIQERQGRPMSLLVLDEVFGSLDADRRQAVLDRLASLKGRFDQIFVISHVEGINEVADNCIFLSRDPDTHATVVSDSPLQDFQEAA